MNEPQRPNTRRSSRSVSAGEDSSSTSPDKKLDYEQQHGGMLAKLRVRPHREGENFGNCNNENENVQDFVLESGNGDIVDDDEEEEDGDEDGSHEEEGNNSAREGNGSKSEGENDDESDESSNADEEDVDYDENDDDDDYNATNGTSKGKASRKKTSVAKAKNKRKNTPANKKVSSDTTRPQRSTSPTVTLGVKSEDKTSSSSSSKTLPSKKKPTTKQPKESNDVVSMTNISSTGPGLKKTEVWNFFSQLVATLYDDEEAEEFRMPVLKKYKLVEVPDYKKVVPNPMDLGTIQSRLNEPTPYYAVERERTSEDTISSTQSKFYVFDEISCLADIKLVYENCKLYNDDGSDLHVVAVKFLREVYNRCRSRTKRLKRAELRAKEEVEKTIRREIADQEANRTKSEAEKVEKALLKAKREAEMEKKKREDELKKRDEEWKARLESEKQAAVEQAVQQVILEREQQQQKQKQQLLDQQTMHLIRQQELQQRQEQFGMGMAMIKGNTAQPSMGMNGDDGSVPGSDTHGGGHNGSRRRDDEYEDDEAEQDEHDNKRRRKGDSRLVNTSSISSDEHEMNSYTGNVHNHDPGGDGVNMYGTQPNDVTFVFVSTDGMEKKRGRKSARVSELEAEHDAKVKQRKMMADTSIELDKRKQMEMTLEEKRKLCDACSGLDYIRMKGVVDILAKGMNRPGLLSEVEIDLDIDAVDNVVLREIQYFIKNPVGMTAKDALRQVEEEITQIEAELVDIRYQKVE